MTALDPRLTQVVELTSHEGSALLALGARCAEEFGSPNAPEFASRASVVAESVPSSIRTRVAPFRANHRKVALVLRGIPVLDTELGMTPASWREADTPIAAPYGFIAVLLGSLLGECIAWKTQQEGRLVTDVLPTQGMEASLVSSSSTVELGWHTEDAFSYARADFVGLLALRDPEAAATTVAGVQLDSFAPDVATTLFEPRFLTLPDDAHDDDAADGISPSPVISGHPSYPQLRIDRDFTRTADPADAAASEALTAIIEHLDSNVVDAPMQVGDMTFIDNRRVVHGRRPFTPRYDGTDRWLKRVNVVLDLGRTERDRHDLDMRVIG